MMPREQVRTRAIKSSRHLSHPRGTYIFINLALGEIIRTTTLRVNKSAHSVHHLAPNRHDAHSRRPRATSGGPGRQPASIGSNPASLPTRATSRYVQEEEEALHCTSTVPRVQRFPNCRVCAQNGFLLETAGVDFAARLLDFASHHGAGSAPSWPGAGWMTVPSCPRRRSHEQKFAMPQRGGQAHAVQARTRASPR